MGDILIILTGGTICSACNPQGERFSQADEAKYRIVENFRLSGSVYSSVSFDSVTALDVLSENMTAEKWDSLLGAFRNTENLERYKGVIVLHGTDTLAYTSALLSLTLGGIGVPVCLVSSQLPPDTVGSNAGVNFRTAVELIMNSLAPNVYAVYQNSDGVTYLHLGSHLMQCANFSDDFFSPDAVAIPAADCAALEGVPFKTQGRLFEKTERLCRNVLYVRPYTGLDYSRLNLDGVAAVVHGTYHTQAVCVDRSRRTGEITDRSVISLVNRCRAAGIPFFLAPCSADAYAYESTGDALENGALPIEGISSDTAYVKTVVGCSLGLEESALLSFLNEDINGEKFR